MTNVMYELNMREKKHTFTLQKSFFRPCPFLAFNHFLEEHTEDFQVDALIGEYIEIFSPASYVIDIILIINKTMIIMF